MTFLTDENLDKLDPSAWRQFIHDVRGALERLAADVIDRLTEEEGLIDE